MAKSREAFRTISEVSDRLDTPAHVLRFWETKFTQIKPVKRAGGRRYYRPDDIALLGGIKTLLHDQGMTIKGVQKMLREQGIHHVAAFGPQARNEISDDIDGDLAADAAAAPHPHGPGVPPHTATDSAADIAPALPSGGPPPQGAVDDAQAFPEMVPDVVAAQITPVPPPTAPETTVTPDVAQSQRPVDVAADPDDETAPAPSRIFAPLYRADPARLRARAAQITPLLARLEALRDRMAQNRD